VFLWFLFLCLSVLYIALVIFNMTSNLENTKNSSFFISIVFSLWTVIKMQSVYLPKLNIVALSELDSVYVFNGVVCWVITNGEDRS
jgi:hypothetical protein